jgi:hypothetical protein
MFTILRTERGFAALIALIMVGMLTLLGLAALSTSDDEMNIAGNNLQEVRAFYAAEAGLETAAATLQAEYDSTGIPPTIMPAGSLHVNQCDVYYSTVDNGPVQLQTLTQGTLAGCHAQVKSFTINDTAVNNIAQARVLMQETFQTALVPIFQFAVFYGNDLEIAPGPDMSLLGRVHSNGNLYLQAGTGSDLTMESYVTASGNILHGRHPESGQSVANGDVLIKDTDGNYVSMKLGTGWLDANDSYWFDSSVARWQGRVQDSTHGQGELNLPLTGTGDPHALIERSAGNPDSYERMADVKIVNDTVWMRDAFGVWQDTTQAMIDSGVIAFNTDKFRDRREEKWVDCWDLDVGEMYDKGFGPSDSCVIYFFDSTTAGTDYPALRLNNAAELDTGLTIASANPVYTHGDFNNVNKKPAAILADAITFLSSNFEDNLSHLAHNDAARSDACNTEVNVCYLTGNVPSSGGNYSGGFENLPRFLEDWGGKDFTWSGSAVNLWESEQATGHWGKSGVYQPPDRIWAYDFDLDDPQKLPPKTPMVRVFQRVGWKQEYVGY